MRRSGFAVILVLALGLAPPAAEAQPQPMGKLYQVGVLWPTDVSANPLFDAFVHGLRNLGRVEGRNIVTRHRAAENRADRLPGLAADLVVRIKVDVILTGSTPAALVAKNATTTIPIVMGTSGDPVRLGLIASLARPGGTSPGWLMTKGCRAPCPNDD